MSKPQKKKRGPTKTALQTFKLPRGYHALCFMAKLFGGPFWFFEQKRSRLQDWLDNEKDDQ